MQSFAELKISIKDWLYISLIGILISLFIASIFYFLNQDLHELSTFLFALVGAVLISTFSSLFISLSNNFILPWIDKKYWYVCSFIFSFLAGFFGFSFTYLVFVDMDIYLVKLIKPYVLLLSINMGFFTFLIGLILHKFVSMKYKNQEIENMLLDSRLKTLENELNPHFLFNTLNSLSELVYINQEKAEKAILDLAQFLRNVISKKGMIDVETELSMVKTYIEIENIRFQDKIFLHVNDTSDNKTKKIPKFSIQLLVENAIKHGYLQKELNIEIDINDEFIKVTNDGKKAEKIKFGTGLANLSKRLKLLKIGDLEYEIDDKVIFIIRFTKE